MASEFYPDIQTICGIDLSDYFIDKSSYNPIVYIHKRYLPKEEKTNNLIGEKNLADKSQQFDYDKYHCETLKTKVNNVELEDPVLDQTIRFAKQMIPLTIPPSTDLNNPVYYTIKPSKKVKRKHESYEDNIKRDITFDKDKSKQTIQIVNPGKYKRTKENLSTRSVSYCSPNNTIDDINENQSLSYSLSESSERRNSKKDEFIQRNKKHESQKIVASDSFEAIAAEYMNTPSDSKIKIHLMNEKDKQSLCENIHSPLVKAIKECFLDFSNNQNNVNSEIQNMHKTIQSQAKKIDRIFEKLSYIEKKFKAFDKTEIVTNDKYKSSQLEEVGQDVIDIKEDLSSEEELACLTLASKSRGKNTPVTPFINEKNNELEVERLDNMARGENIPESFKASRLGIKPERPNRIPVRFCWTDAVKID